MLVVLRSSGTGVMIWHRWGTQICMRLAHASTHLGAYQGAFAIASYRGERVSHGVFADLPSISPLADGHCCK